MLLALPLGVGKGFDQVGKYGNGFTDMGARNGWGSGAKSGRWCARRNSRADAEGKASEMCHWAGTQC